MTSIEQTVASILAAPSMDERVARIRLVPEHHGIAEHSAIYAAVAGAGYANLMTPDYSYVFETDFYTELHFLEAYAAAARATAGFSVTDVETLAEVIEKEPTTLLVFRTITGLLKPEFANATELVSELVPDLPERVSANKVDSMEKKGSKTDRGIARLCAETLNRIMDGTLFATPAIEGVKSKQDKVDSRRGWESANHFAVNKVPYWTYLHQRHVGGAFNQLSSATGSLRGNVLEEAVEEMFKDHGISYVRTGSHNQGDVLKRFGITVTPAPDFVVYEGNDLRAMLECKVINDGGTARDKAPRFQNLKRECTRLGGVPLMAVLGGLGWRRLNDALGPVVRDCDGRVYTLATLPDMLETFPFPTLIRD